MIKTQDPLFTMIKNIQDEDSRALNQGPDAPARWLSDEAGPG